MTLRAAAQQFTSIAAVRAAAQCACVTADDPDDSDLSDLIDQASDMICILTGGRVFGRRQSTIYPCRSDSGYPSCGCGCGLDAIPLGDLDPVVDSVQIDGVVLGSSEYALHRDRIGWNLVRVDSTTRPNGWPSNQAMWLNGNVVNSFSVTRTHGIHIDWAIEQGAIELVCDFAAANLHKANALPRGVKSATMGQVTVSTNPVSLQEHADRLAHAELGPAMTRLLGIYAPNGRTASEVYAPELEPWTATFKS